ncbi:MAG TPA: SurA N-terminal domain-containing protein [Methylomirabilota bacterium]|nr:SurA N-terminal domain-containing protein [Methylomirabilota bacterium]
MITFMRRYRRVLQVGLVVVIAAFIASLFVFGSSGFGDGDRVDTVATVNGERIPLDRYQRRYQAYLDAYTRVYRDRFTPQLAEQLGLPQQVVSDLVQEALVVQRARAEGLAVTDEELNAQIQAVEAFHDGGRFSLARYHEFLRRRGTSAATFEADVRREMTRLKMENTVKSGVKVTDAELEQAFALRREQVRAAWALVELAPLMGAATASDEEVQAHLKTHAADFREPERRRVQYVTLAARDFSGAVTDAEVEKFYQDHAREFETPRQVHAAHALVRVAETGGSEAEDAAKAKVADLIRRAKAGEDFGKLAAAVSEDPGSKGRGGDLGWVGKGEMVPAFEEALFALTKGQVSPEPVRTPFGFHAIKVLDVREASRTSLKEAASQIRGRLVTEAADRAAKARADEARTSLQAAPDFMAEGRRLRLAPVETTLARADRRPMGVADPLEEAAFTLAVGGVSAPVKTPAGYVVLKMLQTIPPGVPPVTEIRDKVVAAVKRQKAEGVALERARRLAAEARAGDLQALARKAGASTGETSPFSRTRPAERLPGDAQLAALQTAAGEVTAPVKTPQGYYVLKVLQRVAADPAGLATERDTLAREVLSQKQGQAWEAWVGVARAAAKVEMTGRTPRPRG